MKNIYFLGIDIQNDFLDIPNNIKSNMAEIDIQGNIIPYEPTLSVPNSWNDILRVSNFISVNKNHISKIILTLDTHESFDLAHSLFWKDQNGNEPAPFTLISHQDIIDGTWTPKQANLKQKMLDYTRKLEENGQLKLCIWPTHCRLGTLGHKLAKPFEMAVHEWEILHGARAEKYLKGYYPLSENYGAIEAEVIDDHPSTQPNMELLNQIKDADVLYVSGQALSHCVSITIRQIVKHLGTDFAKKIVLIEDTTHSVSGFESEGESFLSEFKDLGMQVIQSDKEIVYESAIPLYV